VWQATNNKPITNKQQKHQAATKKQQAKNNQSTNQLTKQLNNQQTKQPNKQTFWNFLPQAT